MTFYILKDDGFKILKDSGFGLIQDPCGISGGDAIPPSESGADLRRDAKNQVEFIALLRRFAFANPLEMVGGLAVSASPNVNFGGAIQQDMLSPLSVEEMLRVTAFRIGLEITNMQYVTPPVPLAEMSSLRQDGQPPVTWSGILVRDAALQEEFLGTQRRTSFGNPMDITENVLVVTSAAMAIMGGVRAAPPAPIAINGNIRRDASSPVEIGAILVMDASRPVQIEFGASATRVSGFQFEKLSGVARTVTEPIDMGSRLMRDALTQDELILAVSHTFTQMAEILTGQRGANRLTPAEWRGTIQRDTTPVPESLGAMIRESYPSLLEYLSSSRTDASVPLERLGGITGSVPGRAEFLGSVAATAALQEDFATVLVSTAAAVIERLGSVQDTAQVPEEWRGSLAVTFPLNAEALLGVVTPPSAPLVVEITVSVTRDGKVPINFYGFALVQSPSLIGTKAEIDLVGQQEQILLVGKIGGA